MWRLFSDPRNRGSNVLGQNRLHITVQRIHCIQVTVQAHHRKIGPGTQPGLDVADPHTGPCQIGAQVQAELTHERLARAINVAPRVGISAGNRTNVDDHAAVGPDHLRQYRMGDHG
ncbi:hypothetical protein D3C75_1031930 [compost metagenome]